MLSKRRRGLRQARFWVSFAGSPVRLKLLEGQHFECSFFRHTDEGWHRDTDSYFFDGREVFREWESDGRDCDGRLTHNGAGAFVYRDYAGGRAVCHVDEEMNAWPAWERTEETRVFDEYAQAAARRASIQRKQERMVKLEIRRAA